jgi:hypothetical protein
VLLGRIPARDVRRRFGVGGRREEEGGETIEGRCSAWSYRASTTPLKEERGRSPSQRRTAGGAGGSNGAAWRPLGTYARRGGTRGGQRGQRGRWEEEQRDAWSKCRGMQSSRAALRTGRGQQRAAEEETERSSGLGTWL